MQKVVDTFLTTGQCRFWAALTTAYCLSAHCLGQGTIVYINKGDNFGTFQGGTLPVDLNADGINDFTFVSTRDDFTVDTSSMSAVIAMPPDGMDLGGWATPLTFGFDIGPNIGSGLMWYETLDTPFGSLPSLLTSCTDVGCIGLFTGQNAYMGVRFQAGDGIHYGWMRLDLPYVGLNGGYIREWAYETRPDIPIFAGAVPEPSTWALLLIGVGVFAFRRRF